MGKNIRLKVHRIPITKARVNLGQVVRRAHLNKECFILEKDGIPVAGIIDVNELEDYLELRDPKLQKHIEEGYKAYRKGMARDASVLLADLRGPNRSRRKKA